MELDLVMALAKQRGWVAEKNWSDDLKAPWVAVYPAGKTGVVAPLQVSIWADGSSGCSCHQWSPEDPNTLIANAVLGVDALFDIIRLCARKVAL